MKEGSWQFLKLRNHPDKLIVGKYNGLHLYEKRNGKWQFSKEIKGFSESSRLIAEDDYENLWMAHGYKGIFKIVLNEAKDSVLNYYLYDQSKGFPHTGGIYVDKVQGQVVFITSQGVSAGMDMALWLVGQIHDPDHARLVRKILQYDPAPPYTAEV